MSVIRTKYWAGMWCVMLMIFASSAAAQMATTQLEYKSANGAQNGISTDTIWQSSVLGKPTQFQLYTEDDSILEDGDVQTELLAGQSKSLSVQNIDLHWMVGAGLDEGHLKPAGSIAVRWSRSVGRYYYDITPRFVHHAWQRTEAKLDATIGIKWSHTEVYAQLLNARDINANWASGKAKITLAIPITQNTLIAAGMGRTVWRERVPVETVMSIGLWKRY